MFDNIDTLTNLYSRLTQPQDNTATLPFLALDNVLQSGARLAARAVGPKRHEALAGISASYGLGLAGLLKLLLGSGGGEAIPFMSGEY